MSFTGDRAGGDGEVVGEEGDEGEEIQGLDVKSQIDWWTTRSEVEHQSIHTSKSTFRYNPYHTFRLNLTQLASRSFQPASLAGPCPSRKRSLW